jgi:hypothetical protein
MLLPVLPGMSLPSTSSMTFGLNRVRAPKNEGRMNSPGSCSPEMALSAESGSVRAR